MDAIGFFVADASSNDNFYIQLFSEGEELAYIESNGPRVLPNSFLGVISEATFDAAVIGNVNERDSWAIDDLYVHYVLPQDCPADLDGNGEVDFDDLVAMLAVWGPCEKGCSEDLDGDAYVGRTKSGHRLRCHVRSSTITSETGPLRCWTIRQVDDSA